MGKKDELSNALKEAMRSGDVVRRQTIRMILSNIKLAEVEAGKELDEEKIIAILQKEIKVHLDAIDGAQKANREDIVSSHQAEIRVVESFLPQSFSPDELKALVQQVINELGVSSKKDMGLVMKTLIPKMQGRATSAEASKMVQELLD